AIVLHSVAGLGETARRGGLQRPLAHLVVRPAWQIDPTGRLLEDPGVFERGGLEEVGLRDLTEEIFQPAILVDPLVRAWPRAELLAVVRVHDELRAGGLPLPELLHRLTDVAERDEVAQPGARRVEDEWEALVLGDEGLAELVAA